MSNTEELKNYLIDEDDGFLLNDDNNGKTIMLSGAWGAGKTHFWLNEIEPELKIKQTNIYVSLYGIESISEIKFEVFKEAYNAVVDENIISKRASFLSLLAPSFGEKSLTDGFEKLNQEAKDKKSVEILKSGSIICLDDFERKSKKIDLNDLFGLISHLALEHQCKVVIILNSDVFEGEEKNVFKNVKEKTVNKYFHFEPTPKELFDSVAKDKKYDQLNVYKVEILKAIEETEELNARIYIQVLDNCLEWIEKEYNVKVLKELVLSTIMFIQNNFLLSYPIFTSVRQANTSSYDQYYYYYDEMNYSSDMLEYFSRNKYYYGKNKKYESLNKTIKIFFNGLTKYIARYHTGSRDSINSLNIQEILLSEIENKSDHIKAILQYGYWISITEELEKSEYILLANFVKTGILPKNPKEVEGSLPPESIAKIKA